MTSSQSHQRAVSASVLGGRFEFQTAPGLFSTNGFDDGARLLLGHLPPWPPSTILDVGCGYGALGIPLALRFPQATVTMIDRDVLAVEMARRNAGTAGLRNVTCLPSLGCRDIGRRSFDWIVCNMPPRIGELAIRHLLGESAAHLKSGGTIVVVAVRGLWPTLQRIGALNNWPLRRVIETPAHVVCEPESRPAAGDESVYRLDEVELGDGPEAIRLERPYDLQESLDHLGDGLPLLLQSLPLRCPERVFIWRGGYGAAAITLARRGARVIAADRDLLASAFTQRNAAVHGTTLTTRSAVWPRQVDETGFDLVVCETSPAAGQESSMRELTEAARMLKPAGALLWLAPTVTMRDWLPALTWTERTGAVIATRGRYAVAQIRRR